MYSIFNTLRDSGLPLDEQLNLCMLIQQYKEGKNLSIYDGIIDTSIELPPLDRLQDKGFLTYEIHRICIDGFDLEIPTIHLTDAALNLIKEEEFPTAAFINYVFNQCNYVGFDYHTKNNKHIGFKIEMDEVNPDWFIELDEHRGEVLGNVYNLPDLIVSGKRYKLFSIKVGDNFRELDLVHKWELLNEGCNKLCVILQKT